MSLKRKKNVFVLTICMAVSFILYQLYFFLTISSEVAAGNKVIIPVLDHSAIKQIKEHVRSEADKFINENGIIRGVHYTMMPRYRPDANKEFTCLNSEQKIPFEFVNDNYCDCADATDEPSTNACVNGTFYCDTQYPNKQVAYNQVWSGKVNDGICDCCDGSDEWMQGPNQKLLSQSSIKHYRHYVVKCESNCFN